MAKQAQTNRSAQAVQDLLSGGLPVVQAAQRLASLERVVRRKLGEALGRSVSAGGLRGAEPEAELTLLAANSAVAARLRQSLPSLLETLQRQGWGLASIKIKIQPNGQSGDVAAAPREKQAKLGENGLGSFAGLSQTLPDSPLRDAVAALVARHGRPAAKGRTGS